MAKVIVSVGYTIAQVGLRGSSPSAGEVVFGRLVPTRVGGEARHEGRREGTGTDAGNLELSVSDDAKSPNAKLSRAKPGSGLRRSGHLSCGCFQGGPLHAQWPRLSLASHTLSPKQISGSFVIGHLASRGCCRASPLWGLVGDSDRLQHV